LLCVAGAVIFLPFVSSQLPLVLERSTARPLLYGPHRPSGHNGESTKHIIRRNLKGKHRAGRPPFATYWTLWSAVLLLLVRSSALLEAQHGPIQ
jgi:hypothetical protein